MEEDGEKELPVTLYGDGTAVSHFHDVEIMAIKIALGIYTREARLKDYTWGTLGYVEKIVNEQGGKGREILEEGHHIDTQDAYESDDSDHTHWQVGGVGGKSDQDFHAMMTIILQDYLQIQERGFYWD